MGILVYVISQKSIITGTRVRPISISQQRNKNDGWDPAALITGNVHSSVRLRYSDMLQKQLIKIRKRVMIKDSHQALIPRNFVLEDDPRQLTGPLSEDQIQEFGRLLSRSRDGDRPKLAKTVKALCSQEECENKFSPVWRALSHVSNLNCTARLLGEALVWSSLDTNQKMAQANPLTAVLLHCSTQDDDEDY